MPTIAPLEFIRGVGDVTFGDPDGYYLSADDTGAQVIVVGPMFYTPVQFARAICIALDDYTYKLVSGEFMTNVDPALNKACLSRGFIRLVFEREVNGPKAIA